MVDFPGVDDEDDSIGDLADLLITVAQIILFVVDYRYIHVCEIVISSCFDQEISSLNCKTNRHVL